MSSTSLFIFGEHATHLGSHGNQPNRRVKVLECINADDAQDRASQGFRYYVSCKGHIWSVPERYLRKISRRVSS